MLGGVSKYQTDILSTSGYGTGWWCVKISDRRSINFRLRYRLVVCENIRQTFYQLQATAQVGDVSKYQTYLSTSGYRVSKYQTQTMSTGWTRTIAFRLPYRLVVCQHITHKQCLLSSHLLTLRLPYLLVVCRNTPHSVY